MSKLLEVIVTSMDEALEAEAGGADRLELVRSLEQGGLTPSIDLVRRVTQALRIPVRAMLRENASLSAGGPAETEILKTAAREFAQLPIDGFVVGFAANHTLDLDTTREILTAAPECRATFHRAFEEASDALSAIAELKRIPQIDRILARGCKADLIHWQKAAAPEITILAGAGLCPSTLTALAETADISEIHIGRAARVPQTTSGAISRERIAQLKRALG